MHLSKEFLYNKFIFYILLTCNILFFLSFSILLSYNKNYIIFVIIFIIKIILYILL